MTPADALRHPPQDRPVQLPVGGARASPAETRSGGLSAAGLRVLAELPTDGSPVRLRLVGYRAGLADVHVRQAARELARAHLANAPASASGQKLFPKSFLALAPADRAAQQAAICSLEVTTGGRGGAPEGTS